MTSHTIAMAAAYIRAPIAKAFFHNTHETFFFFFFFFFFSCTPRWIQGGEARFTALCFTSHGVKFKKEKKKKRKKSHGCSERVPWLLMHGYMQLPWLLWLAH
jgi:hypothetical protein